MTPRSRWRRGAPSPTATAAPLKDKAAWPYPMIEMFLGERAPRPATATATQQPREHIEAQFWIGQWHLLRGEDDKARTHLRVVAARGPRERPERAIARAD